MPDELVMRSVYFRAHQDTQMSQLAHELGVTKSDLMRAAIASKVGEWLLCTKEEVQKEVAIGVLDKRLSDGVKTVDPKTEV